MILLLVALVFLAPLIRMLTRPPKTVSSRFKSAARILGSGVLFSAFVLMLAGLYVESVPISAFYWGYACVWISALFWIGFRTGPGGFLLSVLYAVLFWIVAPNFILPVPVIQKGYPRRVPVVTEEDDRLEDKNPPYVKAFTELRKSWSGDLYYFNQSAAVIGLDLTEATSGENKLAKRIYPTFRRVIKAAKSFDCDLLPSVDLVDGFTKYFDDRMLAAVEEHVHKGSSIFPGGKQGFLKALLDEVLKGPEAPGRDRAAAHLAVAVELGGDHLDVPEAVCDLAASHIDAFLKDPRNSRPVGFYTRTEILKKVFQRDRFLQKPFGRGNLFPVVRLAEALLRRPDLLEAYSEFRKLAERICNPEANLNVEDLFPYEELFKDKVKLYQALVESQAWKRTQARGNVNPNTLGVAFWPFSTSKESRLFARLYPAPELPETEMMNDLIVAIKDGRVSLEPETESGWYDYQVYCLETLVLPQRAHEVDKLLLHAEYKKRLREAFEAMLTKRRETHVKQLFRTMGLCARARTLPATPELVLEPSATNYLRTARAYRFLEGVIRDLFGDMEAKSIRMDDFDEGLLPELDNSIMLFYGLYLVVCNDIAMVPKLEPKEIQSIPGIPGIALVGEGEFDECLIARIPNQDSTERNARCYVWQQAMNWVGDLETEEFLDEDIRVIIPVHSNARGTRVRNWAVVGTRLLKIRVYYARPPKIGRVWGYGENDRIPEDPEKLLQEGPSPPGCSWGSKEYVIPTQVFAEVTLGPKPLTREEFRKICDRCKTKNEIIAALQGTPPLRSVPPLVLILCVVALAFILVARSLALRRRRRAI